MNIPKIITPSFLEKQIQKTEFVLDESGDEKWCLCILTVENGFKITGTSHRQFATTHFESRAKSSAYEKAFDQLWNYYTFLSHTLHNTHLIMGMFSWKTQDTDKSIANISSSRPTFVVHMVDNKNNIYTEHEYEGYGIFGGKDYYELLSEMNGKRGRDNGIMLAYSNKKDILFPNLVENHKNWEWVNIEPENCQYQGFFYD